MGTFIETQPLGLTVLGQVQRAYVVDGQPGLTLDVACTVSTFKRVVSIENELEAMSAAIKRIGNAQQAFGQAMAELSAATAYIGKKKDDDSLTDGGAISAIKKALSIMSNARLDTSAFKDFNGKTIKVNDLRKIREDVKYLADQEGNTLQRNASLLQGVLNKRDSAVMLIAKLRKRLDKTMSTSIQNIGR